MLRPAWLVSFAEHPERAYTLRWFGLPVVCLALFIGQIDVTIVNLALPSIGRSLGASTSQLQWVMAGYSVALAGFVLLGGGLADRYGRKGVFMAGMAVFGSASLAAVTVTEPWHLIVARVVMGLGAALSFPPALSLLAVIFEEAERARAISIWAAVGGVATALGPVAGGFLLGSFSWGSVFLVNVPVTIVAIVGAAMLLPTSTRPGAPALDVPGAACSVVGLTGLVFGLIEGPQRGWSSPVVVAALGIGLIGLVAFVMVERRVGSPMVDVRIFRHGGVTGGALTITVAVLAMAGILFLLPQYLQDIAGDSTVAIGVQLLPFGVTFMLFALVSGRVATALGPRLVITGGLVIAAAGIAVLAFVPELPDLAAVLVGTTLFGTGAAFAVPPATTAVINALPTAQAGDGSAVNQVTRQVGAAFGVAVVGSILASVYLRGIDPALEGLTPNQVAEATASFAGSEQVAAASKSEALARAAETAFVDGYRAGMLTAAILVLLATGAVWVALRDRSARVVNDPASGGVRG